MRLAFISGCLEPGRDGVGDYTRLLAGECARRGIPTQLIAFADRHVSGPAVEEWAPSIQVTRLGSTASFRSRVSATRRAIEAFGPSWASVQFVPYSYSTRGVPLSFVRSLSSIAGQARLHVMFHETWIGANRSWRRWLVSKAQRHSVLQIGRHADVVHTSNTYYRDQLVAHGIDACTLPLFGSVPVEADDGMTAPCRSRWLDEALHVGGCDPFSRDRWWLFAMFGTLHPIWPPEPLLSLLRVAAMKAGRQIAIVSVGHVGSGEVLWREMSERYRDMVFVRLGEQPASRIAGVFKAADFGIATTPHFILGKSATAAAMFDHGLPVIVNRDDGPSTSGRVDHDERRSALTLRLTDVTAVRLQTVKRRPPEWGLHRCADEWLAALERHES